MKTTVRAEEIVETGGVKIKYKNTPFFYEFEIRQRTGETCQVYQRFVRGICNWSCTATRARYGCNFYVGDQTKPFCSHTHAASLFLEKEGLLVTQDDVYQYDYIDSIEDVATKKEMSEYMIRKRGVQILLLARQILYETE